MSKKKSGSPKKRGGKKSAPILTRAIEREQVRASRSLRMLLRVIAWLMQHRDAWVSSEAKVPIEALAHDVDVGLFQDHEEGHLLVVPAPVPPPASAPVPTRVIIDDPYKEPKEPTP